MKKIMGFCILAVLCGGCQAHMMETRGDKVSLFASRAAKPGHGGVIRYLNTGLQAMRRARANDAAKQMKTFCEGSYKVLAEGPRSKFGAEMPIGKSVSLEVDEYWYVSFECETPGKGSLL